MKCFIYWTADLKSSKLWSSQLWTQFKQLRIEASIRNCLNCVRNFDGHSLLEKESCWNRLTGTPGTNELKRKGGHRGRWTPFQLKFGRLCGCEARCSLIILSLPRNRLFWFFHLVWLLRDNPKRRLWRKLVPRAFPPEATLYMKFCSAITVTPWAKGLVFLVFTVVDKKSNLCNCTEAEKYPSLNGSWMDYRSLRIWHFLYLILNCLCWGWRWCSSPHLVPSPPKTG